MTIAIAAAVLFLAAGVILLHLRLKRLEDSVRLLRIRLEQSDRENRRLKTSVSRLRAGRDASGDGSVLSAVGDEEVPEDMRGPVKAELPENAAELLARDVRLCGFGTAARNALVSAGLERLGDVCCRTGDELLGLHNFGPACLRDTEATLGMLGLGTGLDLRDYGYRVPEKSDS